VFIGVDTGIITRWPQIRRDVGDVLSERAPLISSYDLKRKQDGAKGKKQNTDNNCSGRFERHANRCQQASDDS
jgi:hypothetical protein